MKKIAVFWMRRDLRLHDNTALHHALSSGMPVKVVFIFDRIILDRLPKNDPRITFIYEQLTQINEQLTRQGSSLVCVYDEPLAAWKKIIQTENVAKVFVNKDYEPYALKRDHHIKSFLETQGISFFSYKDQVIFEKNDILKQNGSPYTVFTPYKKQWLAHFNKTSHLKPLDCNINNFSKVASSFALPTLNELGFNTSSIHVKTYSLSSLEEYAETRDFPAQDKTSYLSPHLRFGTVSIREIISQLDTTHDVFLSELIWREFFMQILYHFPQVITNSFKPKYDRIKWSNCEKDFESWCHGQTGYPLVDAGMRQLNQTGYMHNRVRMVTASFLCKHLLIDWRWGEAYFAEKLLDFELSSNNGNWQWAAGTGCDAAPYFRIFNPTTQLQKFDKQLIYTKKWVKEFGTWDYTRPIIEHKYARERALSTYKQALNQVGE